MTEASDSTVTTQENQENAVTVNTDSINPDAATNGQADVSAEKPADTGPKNGNINADFYAAMVAEAQKLANMHNGLAEQIKSTGDKMALFDSLKENPAQTGDPEFEAIVAHYYELSDALEAIENKLTAAAEPYIENALKNSGVEEKQAKADEYAKQVKATVQFMQAMNADVSAIPTLAGRTNRTTNTGGDGRGAGTPKYRNLDVYVDGKLAQEKVSTKQSDGTTKNEMRSNLTFGARAANVTLPVFRDKFTQAQGTTDASRFKDRVEFDVTDGKGIVHKCVVTKAKD